MRISESKLRKIVRRVLSESKNVTLEINSQVFKVIRALGMLGLKSEDISSLTSELEDMYSTGGETRQEKILIDSLENLAGLVVSHRVDAGKIYVMIEDELLRKGCSSGCARVVSQFVKDMADGELL